MATPTFHGYGLGALPDPPDPRDHLYAESRFFEDDQKKVVRRRKPKPKPKPAPPPPGLVTVPMDTKVPILDQGQLGSCTANEAAAHYAILLLVEGKSSVVLSRLQIYRDARMSLDPSFANQDSGATGRSCADVLHKSGACPEAMWPYVISKFTQEPPEACLRAAGDHQVVEYLSIPAHELETLQQIQTSLAAGYPVGFSFTVYSNFVPNQTGMIPMPSGSVEGGHRMLLTGYNLDKAGTLTFQARNSWSERWGIGGRCWFQAEHVQQYFSDFWTYRLVE